MISVARQYGKRLRHPSLRVCGRRTAAAGAAGGPRRQVNLNGECSHRQGAFIISYAHKNLNLISAMCADVVFSIT